MRHLILAVLFSIVSSVSVANSTHECQGNACNTTSQGGHNEQGQSQSSVNNNANLNLNENTNLNSNENTNISLSNANSYAEGGQGGQGGAGGEAYQGQSQSSDNSNSSANNASQNTNVTFQAAKTYRNTPNAYAPSVYASGVCTGGGFGVGASGPGYGVSIGGTRSDKDCNLRETARLLGGLGYDQTGFVLLCEQIPSVKQANGGNCNPPEVQALPAKKVVPDTGSEDLDFESVPIPKDVVVGEVKG